MYESLTTVILHTLINQYDHIFIAILLYKKYIDFLSFVFFLFFLNKDTKFDQSTLNQLQKTPNLNFLGSVIVMKEASFIFMSDFHFVLSLHIHQYYW